MFAFDKMDNSELSTTEEKEFIHPEEKNVRVFATQMLKSRLFLGHFQERRYVDSLKAYRDVIVINDSEIELKSDINVVRRRLRDFYGSDQWIGITGPEFIGAPRGHCLWIQSETDKFGHYWYKIKSVRFRHKEILLKLKIVRAMSDSDSKKILDRPICNNNNNLFELFDNFSLDSTIENVRNTAIEYVNIFFTNVLTVHNFTETLKFLSLLLVTSATFSVKGITFFMEFLLKFMREMSVLIQATTPVMIALVNLVGKAIGGFYFLIAMIWRDSTQPKKYNPRNFRAIEMPQYTRSPSLTITEIE